MVGFAILLTGAVAGAVILMLILEVIHPTNTHRNDPPRIH